MIRPKPIKGFHALEFKDEMQARVQAELAGLSGEEKLRKIQEMVESGPFAEWWEKARAKQELRRAS